MNNPYSTAPAPFVDELDESWRGDALCAQTSPEAFFPEKGGSTRDAKRVCAACDVTAECSAYEWHHPPQGPQSTEQDSR